MLHLGQHQHERVLDRAVQLGHPLGVHAGHDRFGERVDRQRIAGGEFGVAERGAVEVELAASRSVVGRAGELRVLLDQVGQRVASLGRVDEVGGDRGVEREPAHLDVELEQRPHQRLDVVTAEVGVRAERVADGIVGEDVGGDPQHLGHRRIGDDGDTGERAPARLAGPRGGDVDGVGRQRSPPPPRPATTPW